MKKQQHKTQRKNKRKIRNIRITSGEPKNFMEEISVPAELIDRTPPKKSATSKYVNTEIKLNPNLKQGDLERYTIEIDKAAVTVAITKDDRMTSYNLYVPEIGLATASLLDEMRNEMVSATNISIKEITDTAELENVKKRFISQAEKLIIQKLPTLQEHMKNYLIGKLIHDMLGLGDIEFLIHDPSLEEIVILSANEPVRVFHKKYGWMNTNIVVSNEEEIKNFSNIIARRVGRQINVLAPLLDAHLVSGDRTNAILYPISTKGNTITIRKFSRDPYSIIDLLNNKTVDIDIAVFLWLAIEYEMNILISGGTASGKTVLLNACMPFIPPNHRIISVEDTRELMLPDFLYWTPLSTRLPNAEGKGAITMLDLLINSLRMRPDRIVLGEMRKEEEARVLFEAMHTGHSVYATLHADSAAETASRLTNPPLNVPANLLKAVNLCVTMFRDRRKHIRRILQVAEFDISGNTAVANVIYRWVPEKDKVFLHNEHSRFLEDIGRNTGMSQKEIAENLEEKKKILQWLQKNNIRDLEQIGKTMNLFYSNFEKLKDIIKHNNVHELTGEK